MPLAQIAPPLPPPSLPISRVCRVRSFPQFISPHPAGCLSVSTDSSFRYISTPLLSTILFHVFIPCLFLYPSHSSCRFILSAFQRFLFASLSLLLSSGNREFEHMTCTWLTFGSPLFTNACFFLFLFFLFPSIVFEFLLTFLDDRFEKTSRFSKFEDVREDSCAQIVF